MRRSKIIKVRPGANAGLSADCPAVVAYRVSWPDELLIRGTLGDIRAKAKEARITRTALVWSAAPLLERTIERALRRRSSSLDAPAPSVNGLFAPTKTEASAAAKNPLRSPLSASPLGTAITAPFDPR
jgi:hypothetical protein